MTKQPNIAPDFNKEDKTMTKHTPGPLKVHVNFLSHRTRPNYDIRTADGFTTAIVPRYNKKDQGRQEADATLIAAAPELLDALKAIIARIEGDFDNPLLLAFGPLTNINNDVREIARAAISSIKST